MLQNINRQFTFKGGITKTSPHVNEVMSLHLHLHNKFISIHEALDRREVLKEGEVYTTQHRIFMLELSKFGYKQPRHDVSIVLGLVDGGDILILTGLTKHTGFIFKAKARLAKPETYLGFGLTAPPIDVINSLVRKEQVVPTRRLIIKR